MEKRKRNPAKNKIDKGKETCWLYQEKCLETPPEGYFGYIYLIINKLDGRIYCGKKQFLFKKKTRLSKKARVGTRKRVQVDYVDSNWQNYWSSSLELKEDIKKSGEENFTRIILKFCENKTQLSYWELYYQIQYEVMFKPSYNKWISAKIFKVRL